MLVIVSHDRELLRRVDQIADLSSGGLRFYGGNLEDFQAQRAAEQAAAEQAVTTAAADLRREKRRCGRGAHQARHAVTARDGRSPRPAACRTRWWMPAENTPGSAGNPRELHLERIEAAKTRLREAEDAVRDDTEIRVDLPGTAVPAGRTLLTVTGLDGPWHPAVVARGDDPLYPRLHARSRAILSGVPPWPG